MGHERTNVDRASESDGTHLQQCDEHAEYAWGGRFAQVGRETAASKRADRYRKNLLFVFRERARLAIGAVAQRSAQRKPGDFEHAPDPGVGRRAHPVWTNRVDPTQA